MQRSFLLLYQLFDCHNFQGKHCFLHFSTGREYSQQSRDVWSNSPSQFHSLPAMLQRIRTNRRAMDFSHPGRKYGNHSGQYKMSLRQNMSGFYERTPGKGTVLIKNVSKRILYYIYFFLQTFTTVK